MQIIDTKLEMAINVAMTLVDSVNHDEWYIRNLDDQIKEIEEELEHLEKTLSSLRADRAAAIRMQEAEELFSKMKDSIKNGDDIEVVKIDV